MKSVRRHALRLEENSHVATPATRFDVSGTLGQTLDVHAQSTNLDDVLPAIAMAIETAPTEIPLKLSNGFHAEFTGTVSGKLDDPRVVGQASITSASFKGHAFDHFASDVDATREHVKADRMTLSRGPTELTGSAQINPTKDGTVEARLNIKNVQIAEMLKELGPEMGKEIELPTSLTGNASATVQLSGPLRDPLADVALDVDKPAGFGEQFDHLHANIRYSPVSIDITAGEATGASGKLNFQGAYQHRADDWKNGTARLDLTAQNVVLSTIKAYSKLQTGVDSKLNGKWSGTASITGGKLAVTSVDGSLQASSVTWDGQPLGDLSLTANTHDVDVAVHATAKVRDVSIDGQGSWRLDGDNPGSATLKFSRVSVATLHSVLMPGTAQEQTVLPFEGFLDGGNVAITVALAKPRDFHAEADHPHGADQSQADANFAPGRSGARRESEE